LSYVTVRTSRRIGDPRTSLLVDMIRKEFQTPEVYVIIGHHALGKRDVFVVEATSNIEALNMITEKVEVYVNLEVFPVTHQRLK
jgi:hypothetical protein